MAYFIYNAAPGTMWFRGNEIKAESGRWTEVSAYAVQLGTFNSMRRLKMIYLVETDIAPIYDPRHPDNKEKVESQAPGAAQAKQDKEDDGSMSKEELQAFLASKNADAPVMPADGKAVDVGEARARGKVEAITVDNLNSIGEPPTPSPIAPSEVPVVPTELKFEELGETEPFIKEAKAKRTPKAKAQPAPEETKQD